MTDVVQRVIEGVVEVLDTAPEICALTERDALNLVPLIDLNARADKLAAIGYLHVLTSWNRTLPGDWRDHVLDFTSEAPTQALANELLGTIERVVSTVRLLANTRTPLDARIVDRSRGPIDLQPREGMHRAVLTLTMTVRHV